MPENTEEALTKLALTSCTEEAASLHEASRILQKAPCKLNFARLQTFTDLWWK